MAGIPCLFWNSSRCLLGPSCCYSHHVLSLLDIVRDLEREVARLTDIVSRPPPSPFSVPPPPFSSPPPSFPTFSAPAAPSNSVFPGPSSASTTPLVLPTAVTVPAATILITTPAATAAVSSSKASPAVEDFRSFPETQDVSLPTHIAAVYQHPPPPPAPQAPPPPPSASEEEVTFGSMDITWAEGVAEARLSPAAAAAPVPAVKLRKSKRSKRNPKSFDDFCSTLI